MFIYLYLYGIQGVQVFVVVEILRVIYGSIGLGLKLALSIIYYYFIIYAPRFFVTEILEKEILPLH